MRIRALIVDDEPLARGVIRHWLADKRDTEVVECGNGIDALAVLRREPVDLVFLDVQMPEMDGFELLRRARDIASPVVVFVTAFDKYALKAFEAHALDYLLKPFDKERLDHAFDRARCALEQVRAACEYRARVRAFLETLDPMLSVSDAEADAQPAGYPRRLAVRLDGKIVLLRAADVHWIEAEGDYIRIHTRERRYLLHDTLNHLAEQLDPRLFVRVHRSTIVNLERILELEPTSNGEYQIVMQDGQRLRSSRSHRERLLAALGRPMN